MCTLVIRKSTTTMNLNFKIISHYFFKILLRTRQTFISTELQKVPVTSCRLLSVKRDCGQTGLASTYLSVLSGKPWPQTRSRPAMSPTNYQDVLQAGSVFQTVIHAVPSQSQSTTGPHVKHRAKICKKLLFFLANTDKLMNQRSLFLSSKPLCMSSRSHV